MRDLLSPTDRHTGNSRDLDYILPSWLFLQLVTVSPNCCGGLMFPGDVLGSESMFFTLSVLGLSLQVFLLEETAQQ